MAADEQQPGARILSQRDLFAGRVFKVRQEVTVLPNGRQTTFDLIRHPGAAAIVPLDTDGNVVLVRQYRHAAGTWLLEVPAGTLGEGEAPEACAFRELIEDTRRERRADFSICDVEIPARVPRDPNRERSWWSIIPFIP